MKKKLTVIIATAREKRLSDRVAKYVEKQLQKKFETCLVDVRDYVSEKGIYAWAEEGQQQWRNIAEKTEAFIIVLAEYNHSFPGEIKILLDTAKEEYEGKPVAICTVTVGKLGGVRGRESLIPACVALGMQPMKEYVAYSEIHKLFNEKGEIQSNKEKEDEKIERLGAALEQYLA